MAVAPSAEANIDRAASPSNIVLRMLEAYPEAETRRRFSFHGRSGVARWSGGDFRSAMLRHGGHFARRGVRRELVLIFMDQSIEEIAVFFGVMAAGGIPAFLPLPSAKQDINLYWKSHKTLLELIQPRMVVASRDDIARMQDAGLDAAVEGLVWQSLEDLDATDAAPLTAADISGGGDEIAFLQHSSGTTGLKKGVMISHAALIAQIDDYAAKLGVGPGARIVSWLPMYHDMGLIACTFLPQLTGSDLALLDPFEWATEPFMLFDAIRSEKGEFVWLPNFAFEHLVRTVDPADYTDGLGSVRAFINCSEPCKAETFERFAAAFADCGVRPESLQVCYAMAETVFAASQTALGTAPKSIAVDPVALEKDRKVRLVEAGGRRLLSNGPILPGLKAHIVDDDGAAVAPDGVGEIVLEGAYLFDGYYKRPEITAERLAEGRYRTRDLGFIHEGEIYVLGRLDDLIIVHGRNYLAHEIEAVVNAVAGLKPGRNVAFPVENRQLSTDEVVVVAERDPAVEVENPAQLKTTLRLAVNEAMGLTLRDALIVDPGWLQKTTSGKISRGGNRDKYLDHMEELRAKRRRKA